MSLYFEGRNIYFNCVFIYSTLQVNYSLYIINRNILFNAIVTRINKYINIIIVFLDIVYHSLWFRSEIGPNSKVLVML